MAGARITCTTRELQRRLACHKETEQDLRGEVRELVEDEALAVKGVERVREVPQTGNLEQFQVAERVQDRVLVAGEVVPVEGAGARAIDERTTMQHENLVQGGRAMPGGDRTGPMGMGPMSGRRGGYCAGFAVPGFANPSAGWGYGMGFGQARGFGGGRGRGFRHRFYATGLPGWMRSGWMGAAPAGRGWAPAAPNPEAEKGFLSEQAQFLQEQLDQVKKRLDELSD